MGHSWIAGGALVAVLVGGCKGKVTTKDCPTKDCPSAVCEDCPKPAPSPAETPGVRYDLPPPGATHLIGLFAQPTDCDLPKRPISDGCNMMVCGENSSLMNEFPTDGLSLRGCRNRDGVRFAPESFRVDTNHCQASAAVLADASLDVVNGEFAVRHPDKGLICTGDDLVGATFQ